MLTGVEISVVGVQRALLLNGVAALVAQAFIARARPQPSPIASDALE